MTWDDINAHIARGHNFSPTRHGVRAESVYLLTHPRTLQFGHEDKFLTDIIRRVELLKRRHLDEGFNRDDALLPDTPVYVVYRDGVALAAVTHGGFVEVNGELAERRFTDAITNISPSLEVQAQWRVRELRDTITRARNAWLTANSFVWEPLPDDTAERLGIDGVGAEWLGGQYITLYFNGHPLGVESEWDPRTARPTIPHNADSLRSWLKTWLANNQGEVESHADAARQACRVAPYLLSDNRAHSLAARVVADAGAYGEALDLGEAAILNATERTLFPARRGDVPQIVDTIFRTYYAPKEV